MNRLRYALVCTVLLAGVGATAAGNVGIDPNSLPAYDAVARHLMRAR